MANIGSNTITVMQGATNATTTLTAGTGPSALSVNPVTNKVYVTNDGGGNVTVIDGLTTTTLTFGSQVRLIVINKTGQVASL